MVDAGQDDQRLVPYKALWIVLLRPVLQDEQHRAGDRLRRCMCPVVGCGTGELAVPTGGGRPP